MIFNNLHSVASCPGLSHLGLLINQPTNQATNQPTHQPIHILHPETHILTFSPERASHDFLQVPNPLRSLLGSITGSLPSIPKPWEIAESYGINLASAMAA